MKTVFASEDDFLENTMVPEKLAEEEGPPNSEEEDRTTTEPRTSLAVPPPSHGAATTVDPEDSSSLRTADLEVSDHTAATVPTDTEDIAEAADAVPFADNDEDPTTSATAEVASTFPQRLMEILDDPRNAELIAWLPHGRAFVIYRKREFAQDVLPKYFQKFAKYSSFTRKLNRWGFVRVTRGPETGAYYHPLFRKNEGRLVLQMTCHSSMAQNNSTAKRTNADSAGGGSTGEANEPPPPSSMMMYPNSGNAASYGSYASYNYPHPNAFAPMEHPSAQPPSYGPYGGGYDPPPSSAAGGGPNGPYSHPAAAGMYPPHHPPYPLMGAPYSMFAASHNGMEGYGTYDEKQSQYSSSNGMLMSQRNLEAPPPYNNHMNPSNYHGGDDAHHMPAMDERGYYHDKTKGGMMSSPSFRPSRKMRPPFYPAYASGGEGAYGGTVEEEDAEGLRSAALDLRADDTALPYSPARRPPAAYYAPPEGRDNEY